MERGPNVVGAEPVGDVVDGGTVGVVEVVAGGEDLDGLDSIGPPGLVQSVEQAGVQALREEDVSGYTGLHHLLRYSREGLRSV